MTNATTRRRPARGPAFALAACLLLAAGTLRADTVSTGTTPGGAHYQIVVPDAWNGGLVIWNHGFSLSAPDPPSDPGPLSVIHLQEGYAVAASSYQLPGWALFKTKQDLEALVARFTEEFGAPDEVILYGASLGGIVTAHALEKAKLGNVTGALMFCGAVAGSRNWDGALDMRLLYDAVCSDVPDAAIPGGAKGLPKNTSLTRADVEGAANACFGLDRKKKRRTAGQKRRLKKFLEVARIPESFVQTNLWYVTFGLSDLTYDRKKMRGKVAIENKNVQYGDAEIDATIERVAARKARKRRLARNYTPRGNVGDVKIVSIHTDKDGLVIVENESAYASVVPPGNLTVGVAVERTPSHCIFTPSEIVGAWEALRAWVGGEPQPSVADLQISCQAWQPLFGGGCRFDPDYVVGSIDNRIRPR